MQIKVEMPDGMEVEAEGSWSEIVCFLATLPAYIEHNTTGHVADYWSEHLEPDDMN